MFKDTIEQTQMLKSFNSIWQNGDLTFKKVRNAIGCNLRNFSKRSSSQLGNWFELQKLPSIKNDMKWAPWNTHEGVKSSWSCCSQLRRFQQPSQKRCFLMQLRMCTNAHRHAWRRLETISSILSYLSKKRRLSAHQFYF